MPKNIALTFAIVALLLVSSAFADVKGRTGSAMKLLGINSSGETVSTAPLAARKSFNLRGRKAERVFGLVNNVFTGQLVSYTYKGRSITYSKLVRKGYCESDNENVAAFTKLKNLRNKINLGTVKFADAGFYYGTEKVPVSHLDQSSKTSVDNDCVPDGATGATLGLGSSSSSQAAKATGSVHVAAAADDSDGDGLPDLLDVDSDGDGVLDAFESASSSSSTTFRLFSNLKVNIENSLNVNAGTSVTEDLINALVRDYATLAIEVPTGYSSVELDCGSSTSGLSYCTTGGTGEILDSAAAFPDTVDSDSDGFGTITAGMTGDFQLKPGATADEIGAGDTFVERLTDSSSVETQKTAELEFIFNTTPAIKSVTVSAVTTNISYPVSSGAAGTSTNCIAVPSSGTVSVLLEAWRAQRPGISGAGEAAYVDLGDSTFVIDIPNLPCVTSGGGCSGTGVGSCSVASYSTSDSNLSVSTFGLQDSFGDHDADAANTLSFTVDLTTCLGSTAWNSGETLFVDLQQRSSVGDNAAQKFCFRRN